MIATGILLVAITVFLYSLPEKSSEWIRSREMIRKLYLFPILLSAMWFGARGAAFSTAFATIVCGGLAGNAWPAEVSSQVERVGEVAVFWLVGALSASFFEQQKRFVGQIEVANDNTLLALAAALESPQRLCALVLVGPLAPTVLPSRLDRVFANRVIGPPATRFGFWGAGLGLTLPPLRRLAHIAAPAVEAERLKRIAVEWRDAGVWRSFHAEQRAFVEEMPALARRIPSLRVPTTIVTGNRDRICPPSQARKLASDLPNAKLIEVRGGHLLPQQRPNVVADAIMAHGALAAPRLDGQGGT